MIRALFVSDIHISSPDDPKYGLFLKFLDRCAELRPEHLFLVGDIFDLWVSDRRYFVGQYQDVIGRILRLREMGVEVHYFEGNHDLDLKLFWQNQLGVHVWEQAAYFEIAGLVVRAEHGDQMDPDDKGYIFLRWFLRTPLMRLFCRYLPNQLVEWLGKRASQASRNYTSNIKTTTHDRTRAVIKAHAEKVQSERPFDLLVSGHVHLADDCLIKRGERAFRSINLGTWLETPMVLEIPDNTEQIQLKNISEFVA